MASDSGELAGAVTADDGPAASEPVEPPTPGIGRRYRLLGVTAAVIIVIDQATKIWAVERLDGGRTIDVFWTLRFKLHRNTGASFSIGEGLTPFIAMAAIGVSIALVVMARKVDQRAVLVAMGAVLGGALGNVVDRFFREGDGFLSGGVVDFIDFQWWPIFNIADMAVVLGGLVLAWLLQSAEDPRAAFAEPDDNDDENDA